MELKEIVNKEKKFRYQLLSRLQMDCNYYLGNGGQSPHVLWAGCEERHIEIMKGIWNSFSYTDKPEWLTWDSILTYENKMK